MKQAGTSQLISNFNIQFFLCRYVKDDPDMYYDDDDDNEDDLEYDDDDLEYDVDDLDYLGARTDDIS